MSTDDGPGEKNRIIGSEGVKIKFEARRKRLEFD